MINSSSDSGEDYGNIKKYYDYNRKRQNVSGLRLASHQFSFSGRCRTISLSNRREGIEEAKQGIARKMKAAGMSDEEIISLTDISLEELNGL